MFNIIITTVCRLKAQENLCKGSLKMITLDSDTASSARLALENRVAFGWRDMITVQVLPCGV